MNYRRMRGDTRRGTRARRSYLRRQWFQALRTSMKCGGSTWVPAYREWLLAKRPTPIRQNLMGLSNGLLD
jgi:hypothetical protein